jgi:hypothetical protein
LESTPCGQLPGAGEGDGGDGRDDHRPETGHGARGDHRDGHAAQSLAAERSGEVSGDLNILTASDAAWRLVAHFAKLLCDRGDRGVTEKRRQGFYRTAYPALLAGVRADEVTEVLDWLFSSRGGFLPGAVIQDPGVYRPAWQVEEARAGKRCIPLRFQLKVTNLRHVFGHLDQLLALMRDKSIDSGFESLRSRMEKSRMADPQPSPALAGQPSPPLAGADDDHDDDEFITAARWALFGADAQPPLRGYRDHGAPRSPRSTGSYYRTPHPAHSGGARTDMSNIDERRARYNARVAGGGLLMPSVACAGSPPPADVGAGPPPYPQNPAQGPLVAPEQPQSGPKTAPTQIVTCSSTPNGVCDQHATRPPPMLMCAGRASR